MSINHSNFFSVKKLLPLLLLLLALAACKKNDVTPDSYPDKIVLSEAQLTNDSVSLSWTRLDNSALVGYQVFRRLRPTDYTYPISAPGYGVNNRALATHYTDKTVPYSSYVEYQVVGLLPNGQSISSNVVALKRPAIKTIDFTPFDVQFDRTRRRLYFFDNTGVISQYDLASAVVTKSVNTNAVIGYSDFATYNGVRELYVPRNDGWVFVYNAETLEKIDQLNVGTGASCVVAANGLLYVSTASWLSHPLKVYNRASKSLVMETGDWDATRFKRIPGSTSASSNVELLEMTLRIGPPEQYYYNFTPGGSLLTRFPDRYHGDYPVDGTIFEPFPTGIKYITSTSGTIYSKSLVYEATLPHGSLSYTTFGFDAASQAIYAGTTTRTVEVYALSTYDHSRTINTKAYPYQLFEDGANGLLCVSSTTPFSVYGHPNQLVVEQIR